MRIEWEVCYYFQAEVDKSITFTEVMQLFEDWLETHQLGSQYKFALATDWYVQQSTHAHTRARS